MASPFGDVMYLAMLIPIFIASITLHEWGHAIVADLLGDPTPRNAGRVTLNPAVHLDFFGTLLLVFAGFGWAKPVPVTPSNFKQPRLGNFLVSAAGPTMNLFLAVVAVALLKYVPNLPPGSLAWLEIMFALNVMLAVLNLLPIPPLDGGHILESMLPRRWLPTYQYLMPFGVVVLLVIVFFPGASWPLAWLVSTAKAIMFAVI